MHLAQVKLISVKKRIKTRLTGTAGATNDRHVIHTAAHRDQLTAVFIGGSANIILDTEINCII